MIPMIETREAVANMDEILDVPGISGRVYRSRRTWVSRYGLVPKLDREEPVILAIYERVIRRDRQAQASSPASTRAAPPMRRA